MRDFIKGEILAIDKPYGMTSFGALAHIRFLLSQKLGQKVKVGHAGTLDPLATGVLILCTGRCTKQIETLQSHTKEYTATLQLGATTASYDREHEVDTTYPVEHITRELILDVLKQFEGDIQQVPPTYSACKVEGTRSYQLRRNGEAVELKPKAIHIDKVELTDYDDVKKTSDCIAFNHFGEWLDSEIHNEVSAAALQRPAEAKPQITPKAAGSFME